MGDYCVVFVCLFCVIILFCLVWVMVLCVRLFVFVFDLFVCSVYFSFS